MSLPGRIAFLLVLAVVAVTWVTSMMLPPECEKQQQKLTLSRPMTAKDKNKKHYCQLMREVVNCTEESLIKQQHELEARKVNAIRSRVNDMKKELKDSCRGLNLGSLGPKFTFWMIILPFMSLVRNY